MNKSVFIVVVTCFSTKLSDPINFLLFYFDNQNIQPFIEPIASHIVTVGPAIKTYNRLPNSESTKTYNRLLSLESIKT